MTVYEQIMGLIAQQLHRSPEEISSDADLMEVYGADSLDIVEILTAIEERFGLYVPDSKVIEMRTPAELALFVEEALD